MTTPTFSLLDDTLLTQAAYQAADRALAKGRGYEDAMSAAEREAERLADILGAFLEDAARW